MGDVMRADTGLVAIRVEADSALPATRGAANKALRNMVMDQSSYSSDAGLKELSGWSKGLKLLILWVGSIRVVDEVMRRGEEKLWNDLISTSA
jgi:hypothetical protein